MMQAGEAEGLQSRTRGGIEPTAEATRLDAGQEGQATERRTEVMHGASGGITSGPPL
jgi:hypothetical protein